MHNIQKVNVYVYKQKNNLQLIHVINSKCIDGNVYGDTLKIQAIGIVSDVGPGEVCTIIVILKSVKLNFQNTFISSVVLVYLHSQFQISHREIVLEK